ncbi:sterile alpha motif domain-containing protein 9-like isoform X2 [Ruditapes philippinarum]|uniref:sterile alpha motif domain-containing protein 9-like isoform X2 n=1 Tax=Ruditapes philippinarum TaxID=129788 RepID=UPI00295A84DD|nr:sterile alpha motif domain-containing protein 9-like isoform X2 [Ruditapes philippinarum]
MTSVSKTLTELEKSEKYHRAVSLNLDCGSDTLRALIDKELDLKSLTFKKYMQGVAVQNKVAQLKKQKILYGEQVKQLNAKQPDLLCMDISLLTILLLELMPIKAQETNIKKLRKKRNELAHKSGAKLDDDIPFNEASQIIIDLSKGVSPEFEANIKIQIKELSKRELVCTHSNLDIVKLHNESLMVKLVESGKSQKVDHKDDIWIKYGLTKFARTLSRYLEIDVFVQELYREKVIDEKTKRKLEQTYNYEEQMNLLVFHIVEEDAADKILKCFACLQKLNSLLADLVLFRHQSEVDIEKSLKEVEYDTIKKILTSAFVYEVSKSLPCEDVHIFVDEQRRYFSKFDTIKACVEEQFPDVVCKENDSQFHGLTWLESDRCTNEETVSKEIDDSLSDMPSDKFSKFLNLQMEKHRTGIGLLFETTVEDECISSSIFSNLTPSQVEEIFSPTLKEANMKFGYGIRSALTELQKTIKRHAMRSSFEKNDILRKFDRPFENSEYQQCIVRPTSGNLLIPVHEFVFPRPKSQLTCAFIGKEVIRFATACLNGKKNGTIHFGIKDVGNGNGEIIGLSKDWFVLGQNINIEIMYCVQICFEQAAVSIAERCIRPVQIINVENSKVVIEVDVVSFSGHMHKEIIGIMFPPKGHQRKKYFIHKENMITTIEESRLDAVKIDLEKILTERIQLEKELTSMDVTLHKAVLKRQQLMKLLTGGNRLVTDAFTPVMFCGDRTCENEMRIQEHLKGMTAAFTSCAAVFDFGSSVELRNSIEQEKYIFQVKLAEDSSSKRSRHDSDLLWDRTLWIYSNGNDELGKGPMNIDLWYKKRLDGIRNTLSNIRQQIPSDRGLVIFLVFQSFVERDPMLEIARDCFLTTFRGECIIIAENDDIVQEWRKELSPLVGKKDLEGKLVTGLEWGDIVSIAKTVFNQLKTKTFTLPDSKGNIVEMSNDEKENLKLNDIEIVDGLAEENCRLQESTMTETEWQERRSQEERQFYKGNAVTWWNFYYSNHVGVRDVFESHKNEINRKMRSMDRENKYEIHTIEHHPGAGGSTLGRHLIWHFSQISPHHPETAYRCCIINKITETTAEEIYRFHSFKEPDGPTKPVMILIDNESEDHLSILKPRLDEIAYKRGTPGNLFCILLIISRVPVSHKSREIVLRHHLTINERSWFDKKFYELEKNSNVNVKTLIAFNVMRHSFDSEYIAETTKELMKEVLNSEMNLMKYLSLICTFESDHPVPETVFDSIMIGSMPSSNTLNIGQCFGKPFGLVWSARSRANMQPIERETWNINISEALQLLITHRRVEEANCYNAVCILSQPLAESVLNYIMDAEKLCFEDIVLSLLDLLKQHTKETNSMSKRFVKLVCSLFKTRQVQEDERGEQKILKFSDLILRLERPLTGETRKEANQRVVKIMGGCFDITNDANIGQQFARFNNHIGNYEAAEHAILRSLKIFPKNSYFLDTYGQIFKSKMEQVIKENACHSLGDEVAVKFVEFAVSSVKKFREAQEAAEANDDFTHTNCFNMEVITALQMLEQLHHFECFKDKENLWQFLNCPVFDIENSSFQNILQKSDDLLLFRKGQIIQQHMEETLMRLESMAYMTRNHLVSVITPGKDVLLLKPRERFLRFYGSKEHTLNFEFMYSVGLKMLMQAHEIKRHSHILKKRAQDADRRLQQNDTRESERDLLVFIGYHIIILSNNLTQCDEKHYHKLLKYSTQLMELQRNKTKGEKQILEAYLYYALLHWPLPDRKRLGNISNPSTYKYFLDEWEKLYFETFGITRRENLSLRKPKLFFALSRSNPGNDIVDLEMLRRRWRQAIKSKEGRSRREVKADDHWRHPIFENCLTRLAGTIDPNGRTVTTKVDYEGKTYEFKINTTENFSYLSNRKVTFVLGFSWMSLVALDIMGGDRKTVRQVSQVLVKSECVENFSEIVQSTQQGRKTMSGA